MTTNVRIFNSLVFLIAGLAILLFATSSTAARPARNGKIAYASDRDGNHEIYVMNSDGTGQVRLTHNSGYDAYPTWNPDGTRIAFGVSEGPYFVTIKTMRPDGTDATDVKTVGLYFSGVSWSPFGDQLAFVDDYFAYDFPMVYAVNANGANYRLISPFFECCALSPPTWSPDGSRIIYAGGHELTTINLYTIKPDGTDNRILIPAGPCGSNFASPKWSRNGGKILFVSTISNDRAIVTANSDGTGCQQISSGNLTGVESVDWSPDGQRIIFSRNNQIFTMHRDGTDVQLVAENGRSPSWQPLTPITAPFDYDGDGKTDISVYRPSNGTWYVARSLANDMFVQQFGSAGGLFAADYDGDGTTDLATSDLDLDNNSILVILNSSTNTFSVRPFFFGDKGVSADFDGDGKADPAVWTDGLWRIAMSGSGTEYTQQWGQPGDKPVPADFSGDGRAELAVWRPSDGKWYVADLTTGSISVVGWGVSGDIPVVGDYSGDGRADYAVYRPTNNVWYRLNSVDYSIDTTVWGAPNDIVTPGDYDGDGSSDLAVFRPSNGTWYIVRSHDGILNLQFGQSGDVPTQSALSY